MAVTLIHNTNFRARAGVALATAVCHGLLLFPALYGHGHEAVSVAAAASSRDGGAEGSVLTWLTPDTPGTATANVAALRRSAWTEFHPRALGPEALASLEQVPQVDVRAVQDAAMLPPDMVDPAHDYIHRLGELTARIQNAWALPRSAPAVDFHCRLRLRQGEDGAVRELQFELCDEDGRLRASLVRAIYGATSLPHLQDSGDGVTLDFVAFASAATGRRTMVSPGASSP